MLRTIDAILEFMTPQASESTHLKSATSATSVLRRNGRTCPMVFVEEHALP